MRSTWLLFLLPVLPVFAGCAHDRIDREADRQLGDASLRAESQIIHPSCRDGKIGSRCGLVNQRAMTEDFRTKFRDRVCQAKSPEDCEGAFRKMIDAELARRYYAADWRAVATDCDLSPSKCDDPVVYEKALMVSHNMGVYRGYDVEESRIEAERRAKHADADDRDLRVLGEVAYALYPGPKCRAYPSVFSGVSNAICFR